jgi:hypothetical protein
MRPVQDTAAMAGKRGNCSFTIAPGVITVCGQPGCGLWRFLKTSCMF